jgi:NodT family efflux transporter outer membrane factor (OMF) lipoprotein
MTEQLRNEETAMSLHDDNVNAIRPARGVRPNLLLPAVLLGLLLLIFPSCTVGPKYHAPNTAAPQVFKESPTQFKENQSWTVAQPADAKLHGKWWEMFNDPELNALEEQLDINNQNIKQFFENFMAARAIVRETRAQYFPTLTVAPAITRSQASANLRPSVVTGTGTATTTSSTAISNFSLPFEASWAPDIWGKVRNAVHQTQYAAQVSAADLENERLTEQASLAQFFFLIRGQDMLQQIFNETVAADQKSLDLTKTLYDLGIDGEIAVVQAQTALEAAQAGATNVGVARAQYEHAIAMLVGKMASDFSIPVKPMTTAPPPIPIGVPSDLLQRRPDVAAAERAMAEANAQIGVAYAAYYPNLTLSGQAGFQSSSISSWLTWPSRFWSVGASVSQPLFDAGLRRATVQQNVATYNANLASYRQTVLTAFQQVEDGLAEVRILSQQVQQQAAALKSAQAFLKLEQARYETGIDPYLNVLIAQNTALADAQTLNAIQVQEMTAAVSLVQALGGGWDRSQLPDPSQVTTKPSSSDTKIQQ